MARRKPPNEKLGRWTLASYIDSGGSGTVWRATDPTGQPAAVKVFQENKHADRYGRFCDEVRFQRKHSDDPGVLPLLDSNLPATPTSEDPAWLATPLAQGIKRALRGKSLPEVVRAINALAETLGRLAARDVAHRDIKPENLFCLEGRWVLGDFGLVTYPHKPERTDAGVKVGPLLYLAPEMFLSADTADGRPADVYSLAKTLWVLVQCEEHRITGPAARMLYSRASRRPAHRRGDGS